MWNELFLGAVALHISRLSTIAVIQIYSLYPQLSPWLPMIAIVLILTGVYSILPEPKTALLSWDNRTKTITAASTVGLMLGVTNVL